MSSELALIARVISAVEELGHAQNSWACAERAADRFMKALRRRLDRYRQSGSPIFRGDHEIVVAHVIDPHNPAKVRVDWNARREITNKKFHRAKDRGIWLRGLAAKEIDPANKQKFIARAETNEIIATDAAECEHRENVLRGEAAIAEQYKAEVSGWVKLADERRIKRDELRKLIVDDAETIAGIASRPEIRLTSEAAAILKLQQRIMEIQQAWPVQWDGWEHCDNPNDCLVESELISAAHLFLKQLRIAYQGGIQTLEKIPGRTIDEKATHLFKQNKDLTHEQIAAIIGPKSLGTLKNAKRCKKYHDARVRAGTPRARAKDI